MSEQFDEVLIDRVAREVYGNTVVIHSGPHSHNMILACLRAISKTHAIVPKTALETAYTLLQDLFDRWSCDEDSPRKWGADLYDRVYHLLESPVFKAIAKTKEAPQHA